MAPTCPSCGVEIAGKIQKCHYCGEIFFKQMDMCPSCHHLYEAPTQQVTDKSASSDIHPTPTQHEPIQNGTPSAASPQENNQPKKKGHTTLVVAFIFALICCGVLYYFYNKANKDKELEQYEYAMKSNDPMVLQSFLDNYPEADQAHKDSIETHLQILKSIDNDWTNALVSSSKTALEEYLKKYPNSPHKLEAWSKIDSLDWLVAQKADNVDAYQAYLDTHADGEHIEEAENAMKKAKGRDLQPEEKQMVSTLFRQFFQSINSRDENGLISTCEDILSSLLGKQTATSQDVVTFMHKLYKEGVINLNWHINNDYQIKKREVGDNSFEYSVQFTAIEIVSNTDGTEKENHFRINAVVSPEGKISEFNLIKQNTEE